MNQIFLWILVISVFLGIQGLRKDFGSRKQIGGRIFGGENANHGEFPYVAALYVESRSGVFYCGGAILNENWVLTAAQCVILAENITVLVGSKSLTDKEDANRQTSEAIHFFAHPKFDKVTLANDIALVNLKQPIFYTFFVHPIRFVTEAEVEDDEYVISIGWGAIGDEDVEPTEELQWVPLNIISDTECKKIYGNNIKESMVCARGMKAGICKGDQGSPLVKEFLGSDFVVGIASFFSGQGCMKGHPSGYTRVYPYINWILSQTGIDDGFVNIKYLLQ